MAQSKDRSGPGSHVSKPGTGSQPSVASLLGGAREGSRQSIGELLDRYRSYLLLLATTQLEKRLQPRISPSDIVQETMLKAHRHFGQFRGQSEKELLAWLRQILISNLAHLVERNLLAVKRDIRRKFSLDRFRPAPDESTIRGHAILGSGGDTPSAVAQHNEENLVLAARLAQLPPRYREVLILRNIQGLSFEEAAERLDCSLGATRMLWLRAIKRLRTVYRKEERHDP